MPHKYWLKKTPIVIAAMFIMMLCAGCRVNPPQAGTAVPYQAYGADTLLISMESISIIDPAYASTAAEISLAKLIFSGLVKNTAEGIETDLAESFGISADGLTYTFYLNTDARFHDGETVTSDDIRFSWERALRLGAPSAALFRNIVGSAEVISGLSRSLSGLDSTLPDQLIITLTEPEPGFLASLCTPGAFVLKRDELVEQGADYARTSSLFEYFPPPSGTGPLLISEWIEGRNLALSSFDGYLGNPFPYTRTEFNFTLPKKDAAALMKIKEMDIIYPLRPEDLTELESLPAEQFVSGTEKTFYYTLFNPSFMITPVNENGAALEPLFPLTDVRTRQALMKAITAITPETALNTAGGVMAENAAEFWYDFTSSNLTEYHAANQSIEPDSETNAETLYDEAKMLLSEAGFGNGTGMPVLPIACGEDTASTELARYISEQLLELNIQTEVRILNRTALSWDRANGQSAIYVDLFSDIGGGMETFFLINTDPKRQRIIPEGNFSSLLRLSYSYEPAQRREALAVVTEMLEDEGLCNIFFFKKVSACYSPYREGLEDLIRSLLPPMRENSDTAAEDNN